jgi:hypothetical protein
MRKCSSPWNFNNRGCRTDSEKTWEIRSQSLAGSKPFTQISETSRSKRPLSVPAALGAFARICCSINFSVFGSEIPLRSAVGVSSLLTPCIEPEKSWAGWVACLGCYACRFGQAYLENVTWEVGESSTDLLGPTSTCLLKAASMAPKLGHATPPTL